MRVGVITGRCCSIINKSNIMESEGLGGDRTVIGRASRNVSMYIKEIRKGNTTNTWRDARSLTSTIDGSGWSVGPVT